MTERMQDPHDPQDLLLSRREVQRKAIHAAVNQEMLNLESRFKFLPADLIRSKAFMNLRIPRRFDGETTRIDWARIGPEFRVASIEAEDQSVVVPAGREPRRFFKTRLPRPPKDQNIDVAPRLIRQTTEPADENSTQNAGSKPNSLTPEQNSLHDTVRRADRRRFSSRKESVTKKENNKKPRFTL